MSHRAVIVQATVQGRGKIHSASQVFADFRGWLTADCGEDVQVNRVGAGWPSCKKCIEIREAADTVPPSGEREVA